MLGDVELVTSGFWHLLWSRPRNHWREGTAGTAKDARPLRGAWTELNKDQKGSGEGGAGREVTRTGITWDLHCTGNFPSSPHLTVTSAISLPGNIISLRYIDIVSSSRIH